MNFYKVSNYFWINLELVKMVSCKKDSWYVYFLGESEGHLITVFDAYGIAKLTGIKISSIKSKDRNSEQ